MTGDLGVQLLQPLFEDAALIDGKLQRRPGTEIGDVAHVVVEALELQQDTTNEPRPASGMAVGNGFDRL